MNTDTGIDLVAYSPASKLPSMIQVRPEKAKPGGGKGTHARLVAVGANSPGQLVALVDMSEHRIWLFTHAELLEAAQQKPSNGKVLKVDRARRPRANGKAQDFCQL